MAALTNDQKADSGFIKSSVLDISVIGCALDSPFLMPTGIVLDIKIDDAPFTRETGISHAGPMLVTGSVTSCRMMEKGRYRLGVKFLKIAREDRELINNFIATKERRKAQRWDMTK
jgi:c-di-GMP-binding flagellar brake protein YcgR